MYWTGKRSMKEFEGNLADLVSEPHGITFSQFLKDWDIRPIEKKKLYLEYKKTGLKYVFNQKIIFSLEKDLESVVNRKECFIYRTTGIPGSGKSWFNLNLAYKYLLSRKGGTIFFKNQEIFKIPGETSVFLTYSEEETRAALQSAKAGDLIVQDETPTLHGKGSRIAVDNLENLIFVAARKNQISLILTQAEGQGVSGINLQIRVVARNEKKEFFTIVYLPDRTPAGVYITKLIVPEELLKTYEDLSRKEKLAVKEQGGSVGVQITLPVIQELSSKLINEIPEDINNLTDFRLFAQFSSLQTHPQFDTIVRYAWYLKKKAPEQQIIEEKKEEERQDFTVDGFYQYIKNQRFFPILDIVDKAVLEGVFKGLSFPDIVVAYNLPVTPPTLAKRFKKFRNGTTDRQEDLGVYFQRYCQKVLGIYTYSESEYKGKTPDIIKDRDIYTVKLIAERNNVSFRSILDFNPEIEYAKKIGAEKIFLLYLNLFATPPRILTIPIPIKDCTIKISILNQFQIA